AAASGVPIELPAAVGRRDGSGVGVAQPIAAVGGPLGGGDSADAAPDEPVVEGEQGTLELE
ncbi:hypothetical protein, partial [Jiangella rhizosphaerae]